jgi:large subunit ribosomal protein L25
LIIRAQFLVETMEIISLSAKTREIKGKQVKQLRAEDQIPAEVYGNGVENRSVTLDIREFQKTLEQAGESTLIDLSVDGGTSAKVLIGEVQRHPLTGAVLHVDLRQVKMDEKLEAEIELVLVNEAPAVKEKGGILVKSMDTVTASCLPTALVPSIEVDLSGLKELNDAIRVEDLQAPAGIEFANDPTELIVMINEPISQEEFDKLDETPAGDASQVEVAGEAKPAEGEAAAEKK